MAAPVICIGTLMVDELFFCNEMTIASTSNPATLKRNAGGVVGNISRHLALLGIPVKLISVLGNDPDGDWLLQDCRQFGITDEHIFRADENTGKYASVLNKDGTLFVAACADECSKYIDSVFLQHRSGLLESASLIITDTNISEDALAWLTAFSREKSIPLIIEPVSVAKARKLSHIDLSGVFMITPNEDELSSVCKNNYQDSKLCLEELAGRGVINTWLRLGSNGSVIFTKNGMTVLHVPVIDITDSTGAGDAALAGWVAAWNKNCNSMECLRAGHAMALEILQVHGAVMKNLTDEKLFNDIKKYYPDEQ
jgi:pseudouridine kinase